MKKNAAFGRLEEEIDYLRPLLHVMSDQVGVFIKNYEEQENYELCDLLQRYNQNMTQLIEIFEKIEAYASEMRASGERTSPHTAIPWLSRES